MSDFLMPKLSDSMEEGTILKWLKRDGESVEADEDVVEIETDKATMTHAADAGGVLAIRVAEGETVPVGAVIAAIGDAAPAPAPEPAASAPVPAAAPEAAPAPAEREPVAAAVGTNGAVTTTHRASPLAARLAQAHGIDLGTVSGSGPRGRITRSDVAAAGGIASPAAPPAPAATPAAMSPQPPRATPPASEPTGVKGTVTTEPLTRLQQTIARRMAEAKATVPEFQVQTEVVMDAAIALRAQLKAQAGDAPVPSFNDLVVKAAAVALRDHPRANGSYQDGGFVLHERINVGVAVATDDGLIVPTVFDADGKALAQIARETRALAERVRTGQITPPELSGGTFTVSNLGMFGMTAITPVINVPQAAILGVGALREVLARQDGEIVDRTLMTLTLTCDHRILYGADAARVLARIRELLQAPLLLAL